MTKRTKKPKWKQFFTSFISLYTSADIDITSVGVAYYILISVFPILMMLASLLPYFQFDVEQILALSKDFFPEQLMPTVKSMLESVLTKPSSSWIGISIATTLWTISRSMNILQKAFNKAYGVTEHRDFIITHLVGISLGIALQMIITLSVLMITFGNTAIRNIYRLLEIGDGSFLTLMDYTTPVIYVTLFLALVMLYYVTPNVKIGKIRYAIPGALFVMLVMGTVGRLFSIYVESYADRLMDFRFVTAVVILVMMLWFVFMANVLITGAVLNATVQSLYCDDFYTRNGDVVSVFNRIRARFTVSEETVEE
ncbi:YihY/virulence factor BrkB family protein [Streptococcus cameli]